MSRPHEQVELAETYDLAGVQAFYSSVGYGCDISPDDRLLVASVNRSIVGAVRLCAEGDTLVLRGMYVAEDRRGTGIGTRLLQSIAVGIGSAECWCIPYVHLIDFYSRIGFDVCGDEEIPPFLAERRNRYTAGGKKVVIMKTVFGNQR